MKKLLGILTVLALLCLCACALADVALDEAHFPDANFRERVMGLFDTDNNGVLSSAEINARTYLSCSKQNITSLKGIEYLTAVTQLDCNDNQLTELDLSGNTALERLSCQRNQLTVLTLGGNTVLYNLNCLENQLTELDVSRNTALSVLACDDNQLVTLDLSQNTKLSNLSCVGNRLTELDVSGNPSLRSIRCFDNQLTRLNLDGNAKITSLTCMNNQLTELDLSGCSALGMLSCYGNQLTELDVSDSATLCETVQQNERATATGEYHYDYFGVNENGDTTFAVDPTVRVIAGSFVSEPSIAPEPDTVTLGGLKFSLEGSATAVIGPENPNAKKITIPAVIKVNGKTYKVTAIEPNAFKGMKKLTTVVIGKNVKTIGKNAFLNCKKLKTITIKTTKLTTKTVGASAFKGVYKKATVKVPAKKLKAYKTLLKKKGLPKTAKVKK